MEVVPANIGMKLVASPVEMKNTFGPCRKKRGCPQFSSKTCSTCLVELFMKLQYQKNDEIIRKRWKGLVDDARKLNKWIRQVLQRPLALKMFRNPLVFRLVPHLFSKTSCCEQLGQTVMCKPVTCYTLEKRIGSQPEVQSRSPHGRLTWIGETTYLPLGRACKRLGLSVIKREQLNVNDDQRSRRTKSSITKNQRKTFFKAFKNPSCLENRFISADVWRKLFLKNF